ncbi:MAG: ThuA domain-containing protein [Gemmataceae bacterium]|nr:ThuA domain-containing protein [Gemmataceae bacterium]MDW8265011.1 ThuA domain-containing protein [Gemmataceae bacterium]
MLNRRQWLGTSAGLLGSLFPLHWTAAADQRKKRVLMFTRSQGFEHSCIRRSGNQLSHAETIVTELGAKHGFDVTCTKDGRVFIPEELTKFDAFLFVTTGDLTKEGGDKQPPMPVEGKKVFLDAIANGKGFVGCHCASDTFHSRGDRFQNQTSDDLDAYIAMLGGEFIRHGAQQKAWMRIVDPHFPGLQGLKDFELHEEWYSLKNFAPDLHVILVQDTKGMTGSDYSRPNYPATWARRHGRGRVFYTSMGHREDVWSNTIFQQILLGGLSWALGNVEADVTPNLKAVTPEAMRMPPPPPPKK